MYTFRKKHVIVCEMNHFSPWFDSKSQDKHVFLCIAFKLVNWLGSVVLWRHAAWVGWLFWECEKVWSHKTLTIFALSSQFVRAVLRIKYNETKNMWFKIWVAIFWIWWKIGHLCGKYVTYSLIYSDYNWVENMLFIVWSHLSQLNITRDEQWLSHGQSVSFTMYLQKLLIDTTKLKSHQTILLFFVFFVLVSTTEYLLFQLCSLNAFLHRY